jgi:methionyl-tRNA formyltransferase
MLTQPLKVAFFGSPSFALAVLEALHARFQVVLVVAQPAKPAGRGNSLSQPAIASLAQRLGLPLAQPARLRNNADFAAVLRESGAEVAVTCAYGKILPQSLLDIPRYGFLNVHGSLLPKYRGAAPIQWAIMDGESQTGITIMQTDAGMDTGPMLLQEAVAIGPDDDANSLGPVLSQLGAKLIVEALERLDTLVATPQAEAEASHARMLTSEDGHIDWQRAASGIYNHHRGLSWWPGSWFVWQGKRIKVAAMRPVLDGQVLDGSDGQVLAESDGLPAGSVVSHKERLLVATAAGFIELITVQPASKRPMNALDWARGAAVVVGSVLE